LSLLSDHYPTAYSPDSAVSYIPLPQDLYRFLFTTRTPRTVAIVLALLGSRDFRSRSMCVTLTQETISRLTGIGVSNVSHHLGKPDFTDIVDIEPGTKRSKGNPRKSSTYDLQPVFDAFVKWKKQDPAANFTDAEGKSDK